MAKSKPETNNVTVTLEPYAGLDNGVAARQQAQGLQVVDKESHELVLGDVKRWKQENRVISDWYNNKRDGLVAMLYAAYVKARDMRDAHLRPREEAIALGEGSVTRYVRRQEQIERDAAAARQREAEAIEQERRDQEAAAAEALAEKLEASSNILSQREQDLVSLLVAFALKNGAGMMPTLTQWANAVDRVGYKDAAATVTRLMKSEKVIAAISGQLKAVAIRRESEAKQAAPIVVDVAPVASAVGKVSGTSIRTYYSCGEIDLKALILAVAENIQTGDGSMVLALEANLPYLNGQARDLKEMFGRVWPMAKLVKRDGVAG